MLGHVNAACTERYTHRDMEHVDTFPNTACGTYHMSDDTTCDPLTQLVHRPATTPHTTPEVPYGTMGYTAT